MDAWDTISIYKPVQVIYSEIMASVGILRAPALKQQQHI